MSVDDELLEPGTPVNLENCHREPIRTPGGIQSHGVLLAADEQTLEVVQASANAAGMFGASVIGSSLAALLGGSEVVDQLRAGAAEATPTSGRCASRVSMRTPTASPTACSWSSSNRSARPPRASRATRARSPVR